MNILLSFHYYRTEDLDVLVSRFPTPPRVFADSGAFSAMTVGATIELDDYIAWIKRWEHLFETYVNLDVIGDPEATLRNQRAMEEAGLHPLPVFHGGSDWSYLERYLEGYNYVALGGMVARDKSLRWAVRCFQMAEGTDTVFHGFGQTRVDVLGSLPWYTVDSSSWGMGHRYAQLRLWDPRKGRFYQPNIRDHAQVYRYAHLIRAAGGDPAVFLQPGFGTANVPGKTREQYKEEQALMSIITMRTWMQFEEWLRQRHGIIRLPNRPDGASIFFADGSASNLIEGAQAQERARQVLDGPTIFFAAAGGVDTGRPTGTGGRLLTMAEEVDRQPQDGPSIFFTSGATITPILDAANGTEGAT